MRQSRKYLICASFVFAVIPASALGVSAADESAGPEAVFLLIGQSNMAGRAALDAEDREPIPGAFLLDDQGKWEPATNPLNRYATDRKVLGMQRLGPGDGFARRLRRELPERTIGLIVNARGGTSIEQWAKGQPLYEHAVERVKALEDPSLAGILWHQGEANAGDADYLERLEQLIADLRRDLGQPELPFIAGQIAKDSPVNRQIAQLPERVERTGYASAEGLKVFDGVHFDRDSQRRLGERYAEAYLRVVD
jgi:hypothetical protein